MQRFTAIGHVGQDPEIKEVGEYKVANFSLATTERGFTKRDGTKVEDKTDWHNVVAWRGLAEIIEKYVHKGDKLYIEGKNKTRSYDDKDGNKRYVTEILLDNIELLGNKPSSTFQNESKAVEERAKEFTNQNEAVDTDDLPF